MLPCGGAERVGRLLGGGDDSGFQLVLSPTQTRTAARTSWSVSGRVVAEGYRDAASAAGMVRPGTWTMR